MTCNLKEKLTPAVIKSLENIRENIETGEMLNDKEFYDKYYSQLNTYIDAIGDILETQLDYDIYREYDNDNGLKIQINIFVVRKEYDNIIIKEV